MMIDSCQQTLLENRKSAIGQGLLNNFRADTIALSKLDSQFKVLVKTLWKLKVFTTTTTTTIIFS